MNAKQLQKEINRIDKLIQRGGPAGAPRSWYWYANVRIAEYQKLLAKKDYTSCPAV